MVTVMKMEFKKHSPKVRHRHYKYFDWTIFKNGFRGS